MWARERARLLAVARGEVPADRYVRGGLLLNVFTGEIYPANVAIAGERIAYVGPRDDMVGRATEVVDASGHTMVPGYIEPHAHPFVLTTPTALARHVLPLGTTALVADNLVPHALGGPGGFERAAAALGRGPLRFYWMVRPHSQSRDPREMRLFSRAAIRRFLRLPSVLAIGEVTRWPDVWAGDPALLDRLALAPAAGKRIEGHTAGASAEKVAVLAAAGLSSDHEPITGPEALERARHGVALMLRQSSLRRDLRALLAPFAKSGATGRLMLTTDGSTPAFTAEHGFVDSLVRVALESGVPPVEAYRMATLNPATYYGRDADLGSIAPGRFADLLLLRDLEEPTPAVVLARGRVAARGGRLIARVPEPPWRAIFAARSAGLDVSVTPDELELPAGTLPVIHLVSAVITAVEERPLADGDLHAALVDRRGRWIATAAVAGFADSLDGLATTLSTDHQVLSLGRRTEAMARAIDRVSRMGGGVALVQGHRVVFALPLPVAGLMSRRPLEQVARAQRELEALLAARGHRSHDPVYTLLFLSADGVWDVRRRRVLSPSRRRRTALGRAGRG